MSATLGRVYSPVVSSGAWPISSATVTRSTPPRVSSVQKVCRRTWLVTWSSVPAARVMAVMTSAMASTVIRVPRAEVNRAAKPAPGRDGRSASQTASASRSLACTGTVQVSSPLPDQVQLTLAGGQADVGDVQAAISAMRVPAYSGSRAMDGAVPGQGPGLDGAQVPQLGPGPERPRGVPGHQVARDALGLAEAAPGVEVLQGGQVLVHRGGGPLDHRDEVAAVVADGPVLRRSVVQRVPVGLGALQPGQVGTDGAAIGPRRVAGQRRALEVGGVLREQLRVLRSQSDRLDCRVGCVLRSLTGTILLRMPVLRNFAVATRPADITMAGADGRRRAASPGPPAAGDMTSALRKIPRSRGLDGAAPGDCSGVAVLDLAAEVSGVLSLLLALPGAWVSGCKWLREHRSRGRGYCPRHARPRRLSGG
jgi:hypothetical protein